MRVGAIPAQTLGVGETGTINVAEYFNDPDGDALTYTAASSNVATASVTVAGSVVTIAAAAKGVASITITARDGGGLSAQQTLTVAVPNRGPTPAGTIPAQAVFVGETAPVEMSTYFSDPDGDMLTYSAASSNATVVSASVTGSVVSLEAISKGTAMVTVTARDPGGLSVQQSLAVTVPNRAPSATGTIPTQTVSAGQMLGLDVATYFDDPDGDALTFSAASDDAQVASAMIAGSSMTIAGIAPGTTMLTVTATDPGGLSGQQMFAVTVPNRGPASVGTIPAQSVVLGQTVTVDVAPFFSDPDGETLSYAAASSNAGVATVTVAGSSITVAGVTAGTVVVTVTAADPGQLSVQQRFSVTVGTANQAPEVVSTISNLALTIGETRDWRGTDHFRDPDGDPLTYAMGSSNAAVVLAVASGGEFGVVALSAGTATVTATASDPGGLSARLSFQVTVRPVTQAPVAISGIEPGVLVEGASARITGSGFSVTAAQNQVSVGGLAARVASANATSLSIVVPWSDCLPPRRDELRVSVGNESDARTVGITPSREELELPQGSYRYTFAGSGCVHLPGSGTGEYLIGVVSTSENPSSLTAVTLNATPGDATIVGAASQAVASTSRSSVLVLRAPFDFHMAEGFATRTTASVDRRFENLHMGDDSLRIRRAKAHNKLMARAEALRRELGPSSLREMAADRYRRVEVGDTIALYAATSDARLQCSEAPQVNAVVRLVGSHTTWLEDLDNPSGTFTDSELADLDAFYAANIKSVLESYFGRLSDVDDNGQVLILMTQEVNRDENVGGYVWSEDLRPSNACATSNHAEIFYGRVPDPDGVVGQALTKEQVLESYRSLIAHEIVHIVQNAAAMYGAAHKTTWEDEGSATLAEQLVAYRIFGHGSGLEMGNAEFSAGWDWYSSAWFFDMAQFFGWDPEEGGTGRVPHTPEQCSWVGKPSEGNSGPCKDRAVYGVPSMVFRYAMDRWGGGYAGGEQALMRGLIQSRSRGFDSLVDASPSWRTEKILADFYITLWVDLQGYTASGMTTWNLHDIFGNFRSELQLQPYTSSSTRPRQTASVRAGSSLFLHWTPNGPLSPTAIKVTSASGGPVPDHISVWALRIR